MNEELAKQILLDPTNPRYREAQDFLQGKKALTSSSVSKDIAGRAGREYDNKSRKELEELLAHDSSTSEDDKKYIQNLINTKSKEDPEWGKVDWSKTNTAGNLKTGVEGGLNQIVGSGMGQGGTLGAQTNIQKNVADNYKAIDEAQAKPIDNIPVVNDEAVYVAPFAVVE